MFYKYDDIIKLLKGDKWLKALGDGWTASAYGIHA